MGGPGFVFLYEQIPARGALIALDLTRCAQVEAASSSLPAAFQKENTILTDGVSFWSGRRGSTRYRHPTNGRAIRRSPAGPLDLTRSAPVEAASSSLPATFQKENTILTDGVSFWSGRRGSNSLPRPWQGRALPDELRPQTAPLLRHLGASGRSRTNDTRIFSPLLYQLSYRGIWRPRRGSNPRPPA